MTDSRIAVPFQIQAMEQTGTHAATTIATNIALRGKRRAIPPTRSVAVADMNTEVVAKTKRLSSLAIGNACANLRKRSTIRLSSVCGITAGETTLRRRTILGFCCRRFDTL